MWPRSSSLDWTGFISMKITLLLFGLSSISHLQIDKLGWLLTSHSDVGRRLQPRWSHLRTIQADWRSNIQLGGRGFCGAKCIRSHGRAEGIKWGSLQQQCILWIVWCMVRSVVVSLRVFLLCSVPPNILVCPGWSAWAALPNTRTIPEYSCYLSWYSAVQLRKTSPGRPEYSVVHYHQMMCHVILVWYQYDFRYEICIKF